MKFMVDILNVHIILVQCCSGSENPLLPIFLVVSMMFFTNLPKVSIAQTPQQNIPVNEHQEDKQSNAMGKRIFNDLNDDPNVNEDIQGFDMHLNMHKIPKFIQVLIH